MQIKKLSGLKVQVIKHKPVNQCKGAGLSEIMSNSTIKVLTEALADQNNKRRAHENQEKL